MFPLLLDWVVGELIGTATNTKKGLMGEYIAPVGTTRTFTSTMIRIKLKSSLDFLISSPSDNAEANLYYVSFGTPSTKPEIRVSIKSICIINDGNKLKAKKDASYLYLSKSYGCEKRGFTITPLSYMESIETDSIALEDVPSDAVDIEVL